MKVMGVKVMKSELNAIFALFDEDGDGGLSIDEFMASLIKFKHRSRVRDLCASLKDLKERMRPTPPSLAKINPADFTGGDFSDINDRSKQLPPIQHTPVKAISGD